MLLRDEIAEALLDAGDDDGGTADRASAVEATGDADAETMSHLLEEAADAQALTGAMSAEDPFAGDGSSPR
jgi:hypothetical protein